MYSQCGMGAKPQNSGDGSGVMALPAAGQTNLAQEVAEKVVGAIRKSH